MRDAFAVVHIPDGSDVSIQNGRGIKTDSFGNAIVPTLTAYRHNVISVNTQGRDDLDIEAASVDVVPTKGAAVPVNFDARVGRRGLITLIYLGKPVPFGAIVTLDSATAIVGDDGEVWLTGLQKSAAISVQWGEETGQQCKGTFTVPTESTANILKSTVNCR